jgi:hypothetical protein
MYQQFIDEGQLQEEAKREAPKLSDCLFFPVKMLGSAVAGAVSGFLSLFVCAALCTKCDGLVAIIVCLGATLVFGASVAYLASGHASAEDLTFSELFSGSGSDEYIFAEGGERYAFQLSLLLAYFGAAIGCLLPCCHLVSHRRHRDVDIIEPIDAEASAALNTPLRTPSMSSAV